MCTGAGRSQEHCQCANFRNNDTCVDSCYSDQYVDEANKCRSCSSECLTCNGAGADRCLTCKELKVPTVNKDNFNCTSECPDELPFVVDRLCAARPQHIEIIIGALVTFCTMLVLVLFCCCKAEKAQDEKRKILFVVNPEKTVPICPSGVCPNMHRIRIIKESEIRKGCDLGSGQFGQVSKGLWMPEKENLKIPIALKSLWTMNDRTSSNDFMTEVETMASLDHPSILKLLAVCLTGRLEMITQLMPLGSLLSYLRSNRNKIGSETMLNWSVQMAQGMAYLEGRQLVHRDLAARNVLVKTPTSIRIADFGMTKLLRDDSPVGTISPEERLPIKWLAPECTAELIFTSKSDVWAFGVTIWEVLTYGDVPYKGIAPANVPALVGAGEKLPQPEICSIELYGLLLRCWNIQPDLRPTFSDLEKLFIEKAGDPGRYLVIVGDKLMRPPELSREEIDDLYKDLIGLDPSSGDIVEAGDYRSNELC
jgi:epidermal growth factor receptor